MAVLGAAVPAQAFFNTLFHEGPATAAVPVTEVDATPLPLADGVAVAPDTTAAAPIVKMDTQVEQDRKLALTRQKKLQQAMKDAVPTAVAPVVAAVAAPVAPSAPVVASVAPLAPQVEPIKQIATISVTQSGDNGEVVTPQLVQEKKIADLNRRQAAAQRARAVAPARVAQQQAKAVKAPVVAAVRKPAAPALIHVTKTAEAMAAIAPAAGTPAPQQTQPAAPAAPAPEQVAPAAPANGVDSFINRIMSYHRADGTTTAAAPVDKGTLTLETLLASASINGDSLMTVPGAPTALKWNAGHDVSGMYEQLPARDTMEKQVDAYLDRYRRDCASGLVSKVGKADTVAAGTLVTAEAGCKDKSNAYVTTFLFLQDGKNFNAVIHSAYPAARGEAFTVRDKMIAALRGAQRFAASFVPKETTSIQ